MDKRELSRAFRDRFRLLLADVRDDLPGFLEKAGLDRSALSQLRDPNHDRLPRAETLRRIAEATGVSVDWLLALSNAREGRQELTQSSELLAAATEDGQSVLSRWQAEAAGHKVRYVPAVLPDMLSLTAQQDGAEGQEKVLTGFDLEEIDLEIAMPMQTLELLAARGGQWRGMDVAVIRRQIKHTAQLCDAYYPALRLHLFDAAKIFSAPFTVFGRMRASVYVGQAFISVTSTQEVRFFTKKFDDLVRRATIPPDAVPAFLNRLLG
ncbi:MAG: transcriptional regulator [Pseudomonadota bacterium]